MSMYSTVQILIGLYKFVNLGFRQQGVYCFRFSIYHLDGTKKVTVTQKIYGHPYYINTIEQKKKISNIKTSQLFFQQNYYYSPCFNIIYDVIIFDQQEQNLINEIVSFRTQLESYNDRNFLQKKFYLEVQLMKIQASQFNQFDNQYANFKVISTFKGIYHGPSKIVSYIPIQFEQKNTCFIDAISTSIIIQYKFKKKNSKNNDNQDYITSYLKFIQGATNKCIFLLVVEYQFTQKFNSFYLKILEEQYNFIVKQIDEKVKESGTKIDKIKKAKELITANNEKKVQHKTIFQEIKDIFNSKQKEAKDFLQNLHSISKKIYPLWKIYNQMIYDNFKFNCLNQKKKYKQKVKEKWEIYIFKHQYFKKQDGWSKIPNSINNQQCAKKRRMNKVEQPVTLKIQNADMFPSNQQLPILFYQKQILKNNQKNLKDQKNFNYIIFLVHGFQANRFDMHEIKNILSLTFTNKTQIYCSQSNQGQTIHDLEQMGQNLSKQVIMIIGNRSTQNLKITFIGHSMGGIIIRAAVTHLKQFQKYFHSFISIATPHIGFLYSSTILDAGLWYLNIMQKCQSIKQLSMKDHTNYQETFLYKLSKNGSLDNFKHLFFIGSHQDGYAPFYSARLQKTQLSIEEQKKQIRQDKVNQSWLFSLQDDRQYFKQCTMYKYKQIGCEFCIGQKQYNREHNWQISTYKIFAGKDINKNAFFMF